jgi:RimJ/RimL family protein N-acetyltransferase
MLADPEVMRYIGEGRALDRAETWRAMALSLGHWALRGFGLFAVEEKATGALVGRIGLLFPEVWPSIELAWTLARARWGEGFATEGAAAVRDYAFRTLGLPRLISLIAPENAASIRVAERIGERFDRTGELLGKTVSVYTIEA